MRLVSLESGMLFSDSIRRLFLVDGAARYVNEWRVLSGFAISVPAALMTSRTARSLPEGFQYQPELISSADEEALLSCVRSLPFRDFEFHGYTGKRRVVSFGWHYDFSGRRLMKADDIPDYRKCLCSLLLNISSLLCSELRQKCKHNRWCATSRKYSFGRYVVVRLSLTGCFRYHPQAPTTLREVSSK